MNSLRRAIPTLILIVVIFSTGLSAGIILDHRLLIVNAAGLGQSAGQLDTGLIQEAWTIIKDQYADRPAVKPKQLTYGAISGMVDALGDTGHSVFMNPEMVKEEHSSIQGEFEGIGAYVESKDGHAVILAPLDGSPAQKAGLLPGDIIINVNGESVAGLSLSEVVGKVLGPAGTQVTLTVQNPDTGETRDVTITRAKIEVKNVTWEMLPGTNIGHIRIAGFSQGITNDLQRAIQDIRKRGGTSIILDLRNNPGGLLDEAVGVTSQFLSSGNVMLEQDADGNVKPLPVKSGGIATDIPMVVLINKGSASASEIVAGALQDAGRAQLVGETTFGTGTVLREFSLADGSALLLATQLWLTPKGRVIWHKGITPDIEVKQPVDVKILIPEGERGLTTDQLHATQDEQLLKAVELLTTK